MGCECKQATKDGLENMMLLSLRGASSHSHNKQVTHVSKSMYCWCSAVQIEFSVRASLFIYLFFESAYILWLIR